MCRKFLLSFDPDSIFYKFREHLPEKYHSLGVSTSYQPSQHILALTHTQKGLLWYTFQWGLVPHWYKPGQHTLKFPYNARIEDIASKPMFRSPIRFRRCLIPATGFFEGQATPQSSQPYLLGHQAQELFAFAGIWDTWQDPDTNHITHSAAILTQAALPQFNYIHHRLPIILSPANYQQWLTAPEFEIALQLCHQESNTDTASNWQNIRVEHIID